MNYSNTAIFSEQGGGGVPVIPSTPNSFMFAIDTTRTTTGTYVSGPNQWRIPFSTIYPTGVVDFTIVWGDGTADYITDPLQDEVLHTYPAPGIYYGYMEGPDIRGIRGENSRNDRQKWKEITQWGNLDFNLDRTFSTAQYCIISATDAPIITTTSMSRAFYEVRGANNKFDLTLWDFSGVVNFERCFYNCSGSVFVGLDVALGTNIVSNWNATFAFNFGASDGRLNPSQIQLAGNCRQILYYTVIGYSLADWDLRNITDFREPLGGAGGFLNVADYDATLISFSNQADTYTLTLDVSDVDFGNASKYTPGGAVEIARNNLITTHGWVITDGGPA